MLVMCMQVNMWFLLCSEEVAKKTKRTIKTFYFRVSSKKCHKDDNITFVPSIFFLFSSLSLSLLLVLLKIRTVNLVLVFIISLRL